MLKYLLLSGLMLLSSGCAMYALDSGQVVVTDSPRARERPSPNPQGYGHEEDNGGDPGRHHQEDNQDD